jgi:hypothetical protein
MICLFGSKFPHSNLQSHLTALKYHSNQNGGGGMLGGLPGGNRGTMTGGGLLGGLLGGGLLGSLFGAGRGFSGAGGLLGRVLGRGRL